MTEEQPVRIEGLIPAELDRELADWRRKQPDLPSRIEAIRRLLRKALEAER